jgi:hypothetical protein
LSSEALPDAFKSVLKEKYELYNPVVLQQNVNRAVHALLAVHKAKVTFSK